MVSKGWRGTLEERFWRFTIPEAISGCWLWRGNSMQESPAGKAGRIRKPYGKIWIDGRTLVAHRFAWELFNGPIPEGKIVCHKCDVAACVNPEHLFLGTHRDNTSDMIAKGRMPVLTSDDRSRKLTTEDARVIRRLCESGRPQSEAANAYGISQTMVSRILLRKAWANA